MPGGDPRTYNWDPITRFGSNRRLGVAVEGQLAGRVAVVTGATSGIGRAIAEGLAAEGARVTLAGRSVERGEAVVEAIAARGGEARFVPTDITNPEECSNLIDGAAAAFGRIDVMVNSAGSFPLGMALDVEVAHFDDALNTNVKGTYFCGQAALRHMVKQGDGGAVINMASIAGLIGFAGADLYAMTKGAILGLTKTWGVEFAPHGIRVNAIAPGNVETPMNEHLMADPDYAADMISRTPLGRNGRVEDIVPAVVLLAGDGGAYFSGSVLVIDGGWTAA
ncbi:SDR family NAD(P)-dependent oxidoreductase [Cryptosporangium sp. NPDC051539]|uniref:SDR family NAD(P)-dependent oxidoreductase n=1 Tax=Cryptosporangium sp. NPDC051539 TaxID=3363962 RepID=UPI003787BC40